MEEKQDPMPISDEADRQDRELRLMEKIWRGEPWTKEEREEAVACHTASREAVDQFEMFIKAVRDRGFDPNVHGGIDCDAVRITNLPRTADGGYILPALLDDVTYRGNHLDYLDPEAPEGNQVVQWIGRHRKTGQLVAHTCAPQKSVGETDPQATGRRQWFARFLPQLQAQQPAPLVKHASDAHSADTADMLSQFSTPDYECVWLR